MVDDRSYMVGRAIAWGVRIISKGISYYTFNTTKLLERMHLSIFPTLHTHRRNDKGDYYNVYIGKVEENVETLNGRDVEAGIILGSLEKYLHTRNSVYPFINEAKPTLLHIKLNTGIDELAKRVFGDDIWIKENFAGKKVAVLDVSEGLRFLEDKIYFKILNERCLEKRSQII